MRSLKQLRQAAARRYTSAVSGEHHDEYPIQTGALPWRLAKGEGIEIMLVTGRRSGRWSIPKGWPMPGKTLAEAAAQEAFEEAGVNGTIDPRPVGKFRHVKQMVVGSLEVEILVHPLWVDQELAEWPELGERKRKWFTIKDAAKRVDSCELAELIREVARRRVPDRSAASSK